MHNILEVTLRRLRDEMLEKYPQFCTCEQCKDDTLTWALNHCRPKYVTGSRPMGMALTAVELALDQSRAELTVIVFDALRRVAANPRHHTPPEKHPTTR
jgi:competence protein ComFB